MTGSRPSGVGTHGEDQIAAVAADLRQQADQSGGRGIVIDRLVAIETVAVADAAILLPGMPGRILAAAIFARIVIAMLAAALSPAIVDHHKLADRRFVIKPGRQFFGVPLAVIHVPLAVEDDDGRLVAGDQFLELRMHVFEDESFALGRIEPQRVKPLIERKVDAHLQAAFSARRRQFAQQVAIGSHQHAVPLFHGIVPSPSRREALLIGSSQVAHDGFPDLQRFAWSRSAVQDLSTRRNQNGVRQCAGRLLVHGVHQLVFVVAFE